MCQPTNVVSSKGLLYQYPNKTLTVVSKQRHTMLFNDSKFPSIIRLDTL